METPNGRVCQAHGQPVTVHMYIDPLSGKQKMLKDGCQHCVQQHLHEVRMRVQQAQQAYQQALPQLQVPSPPPQGNPVGPSSMSAGGFTQVINQLLAQQQQQQFQQSSPQPMSMPVPTPPPPPPPRPITADDLYTLKPGPLHNFQIGDKVVNPKDVTGVGGEVLAPAHSTGEIVGFDHRFVSNGILVKFKNTSSPTLVTADQIKVERTVLPNSDFNNWFRL